MAKKNDVQFKVTLDKRTINWFNQYAPKKLTEARTKAVEAAGMVWADETKELTTSENHVDTGLYVNSVGYASGSPADPLHEIIEENQTQTTLALGADVAYAEVLEKRFGLMARGIDLGQQRMENVAVTQVRNTLFGR